MTPYTFSNNFRRGLGVGLLLLGLNSYAQQLPQFTQYMYNTISVNPAYAGSRGTLNATALHRNQWAGLEGNPTTTTVSVHAPMRNEKVGLGFSFIQDGLGDETSTFLYGDFSYSIFLNLDLKLSFGLKAGFTSYNLNAPDPNDPFFSQSFNSTNPNMGAGIYLTTDRWYLGVSTPRMFTTDLNDGEFEALERNSYYTIAGFVVDVNEDIKFKPTALAKITNGAPASYDVTANFLFYDRFWAGISYRFNDAANFGAIVDYQLTNDIRIGYAYDLPTSTIRPYSGGTHEIILIYEVLFNRTRKVFKTPRYF